MTPFEDCHASSEIARRLTNDGSGSVVVLEDGDPRFGPRDDGAEWDWDAEALPGAQRCEYCGALEPLFRLEDGVTACGACVHGRLWEVVSTPPAATAEPAQGRVQSPQSQGPAAPELPAAPASSTSS